jgi:Septum formation initiator.
MGAGTLNNKIKRGSRLSRIVIVFIIVLLVFSAFKLQLDLNGLKTQKKELSSQLKASKYEVERMQSELDRVTDDEYIAKVAREKLNYRDPNELVFYNDLSD